MDKDNDILFATQACVNGQLGLICLNKPETLNALTHEMIVQLTYQLIAWEKDPNTRAVVIFSSDKRAFCAGGDIRAIYEAGITQNFEIEDFFWDEYRLNRLIANYRKPYIVLLDGITMGGGVGISVYSKIRIGSENLKMAMPETGIGFFPDVGASYFLPSLPGYTGFYLGLTGAPINVTEAIYLNLVDFFIPSSAHNEFVDTLAKCDLSTYIWDTIDDIVKSFIVELEENNIERYRKYIDNAFSAPTIEEIYSRLGKIDNEWAEKTIKALWKKSPTSLKVTHEQLTRGLNMELDNCLEMEYRIVKNFLRCGDFYEGVRALIIDKDYSPIWYPLMLEDISDDYVDSFFKRISGEDLHFRQYSAVITTD